MTTANVKCMGVALTQEQYDWLRKYSQMRTVSMSAALRLIIDDYRSPNNWLEFMNKKLGKQGK